MKRLSFQWQRCGYNSFLPCDLVTILCHDAAARLRGELAKRKLICISADAPLADKLQDIEDVRFVDQRFFTESHESPFRQLTLHTAGHRNVAGFSHGE